MPAPDSSRRDAPLTEADVRRIVREEIALFETEQQNAIGAALEGWAFSDNAKRRFEEWAKSSVRTQL